MDSLSNDIRQKLVKDYFLSPDMIKFLLAENLALKTLLHNKSLITPEEFKEVKESAYKILDEKVSLQIEEFIRNILSQEDLS